jgi:hypothetical protein
LRAGASGSAYGSLAAAEEDNKKISNRKRKILLLIICLLSIDEAKHPNENRRFRRRTKRVHPYARETLLDFKQVVHT